MKTGIHFDTSCHQQRHFVRLQKERNELQKAIDAAERKIRTLLQAATRNSLHTVSEEQVLVHRALIYRERLNKVEQGLKRIRDGKFGLCLDCESLIGDQRLKAVPSALYCVRCQQQHEQLLN